MPLLARRFAPPVLSALVLLLSLAAGTRVAALGPSTVLISRGIGGAPTVTWATSTAPVMSQDGRYVAFLSNANNFAGTTNGAYQVFVRDRITGAVELASRTSAGVPANGSSSRVAISGDGRFVVFSAFTNNLVAGLDGSEQVFVHDRATGATELVSVTPEGRAGNDYSGNSLTINADGRYVAFSSSATDLVSNDTNGVVDLFVRDRLTGVTRRVSVGPSGVEGDAESGLFNITMSGDGRYVEFTSEATDLSSIDPDHSYKIFVADAQAGTLDVVVLTDGGVQPQGTTEEASISADGRYVAYRFLSFQAFPSTFTGGLFVWNRLQHTNERVAAGPSGEQGTVATAHRESVRMAGS